LNKLRIPMITLAAGLAFSGAVSAQVLAWSDYRDREDVIAARYRSAYADCTRVAGHARTVCVTQASADARIARAELEAHYRPSAEARHYALTVAANSRHEVALARCDGRSRIARNTCVKQAGEVRTAALSEAMTLLDAARANARASEQSVRDNEEASGETFEARAAAARQQCDGYVDKTKELCLAQTSSRFVKP
jgi:hypothetical protein